MQPEESYNMTLRESWHLGLEQINSYLFTIRETSALDWPLSYLFVSLILITLILAASLVTLRVLWRTLKVILRSTGRTFCDIATTYSDFFCFLSKYLGRTLASVVFLLICVLPLLLLTLYWMVEMR